jgi:hypothetical protein
MQNKKKKKKINRKKYKITTNIFETIGTNCQPESISNFSTAQKYLNTHKNNNNNNN